jgi:hypothetical protein
MFMFTIMAILAVEGQLKIVEPLHIVENLSAQQCVDMIRVSKDVFDLSKVELRCVKTAEIY